MDGRHKRKYDSISDNAVQNHVEENPDFSVPFAINTIVHRRDYFEDGFSADNREIEPRKGMQENNDNGMHVTINSTATEHYVSDRYQMLESCIVRSAFEEYLLRSLLEGQ